MKTVISKQIARLGDLVRKMHITTSVNCADYIQSRTPAERRLMLASAAVTFTVMCFATAAYADDGIAGMFNKAADQGESIKLNLGKLFSAMGFACAGYGGYNWWRKGKEGDHSQIKAGQIFIPLLAGAALGATGFVMIKMGETIGIQSSSQGALPG